MSFILSAIAECLTGTPHPTYSILVTEKYPHPTNEKSGRSDQDVADEILELLFNASKNDPNLEFKLQSVVGTYGLKESITERVLNDLESAFENGAPMVEAVKNAFERSVLEAYEFAKDYSVYFAIIALGVLVLMAPGCWRLWGLWS